MRIRTLDHYEDFHCLAGACPHSCCTQWDVVIDEETAERYTQVGGALGERLRKAYWVDEAGELCFHLDGGRCPFLNAENLCEIHLELGEEATSETCQMHPRFIEDYGPFREISLSASCPEANRLLLSSQAPLRILEQWDDQSEEEGDDWLPDLLPLRARMLDMLQDRSQPIHLRLRALLRLAQQAQVLLDEDEPEQLNQLILSPDEPVTDGPRLFPKALGFLAGLTPLEPDWREILQAAETAEPAEVSEALLERIAFAFLFRYMLKCVNDGDLLGRVQLCVFLTLTAERLAPVCGLGEALRRLSAEIEHSEENLNCLLEEGFWYTEYLSVNAMERELSAN